MKSVSIFPLLMDVETGDVVFTPTVVFACEHSTPACRECTLRAEEADRWRIRREMRHERRRARDPCNQPASPECVCGFTFLAIVAVVFVILLFAVMGPGEAVVFLALLDSGGSSWASADDDDSYWRRR